MKIETKKDVFKPTSITLETEQEAQSLVHLCKLLEYATLSLEERIMVDGICEHMGRLGIK